MGSGCATLFALWIIYKCWPTKKSEQNRLQARRERLRKFQETGDLADLAEDDITIIVNNGKTELQIKNKLLHQDRDHPWG
jgi:hypothetical protein